MEKVIERLYENGHINAEQALKLIRALAAEQVLKSIHFVANVEQVKEVEMNDGTSSNYIHPTATTMT